MILFFGMLVLLPFGAWAIISFAFGLAGVIILLKRGKKVVRPQTAARVPKSRN